MVKKKYQFDVFLSYSHLDSAWVDKLKSALEDRGLSVWRDKENIRPGDLFAEALEKGIESSQTVVMAVSKASLNSKWVSEEYYRALTLVNKQKSRIIACVLEEVDVPGFLSSRQYIDFSDEGNYESDYDFESNVDRLIWPGLTGKEIKSVSFVYDNRDNNSLRDTLMQSKISAGYLGGSRMHEWFSLTDPKEPTLGHRFFPKKSTYGVVILDLLADEYILKTGIEFILKCRNSKDDINENIEFVFYHEAGWLEKLNQLKASDELIYRFSHYFVIEKTSDKDKLRKNIRYTWNLVQQDLMRKEKR